MISMAVNQAKMMMSVQSLDEDEKIDKKLNVALSRARQQLILMGNEQILNNAKFYSELVIFIKKHGIFIKRQDTHQFFEKTILPVKSQNV
jgi:DNA replication ATP-dependent helicase Dna2